MSFLTTPPRRHQILANATVNASGNSGALVNLGQEVNPIVVAYLYVSGAVAGTSPSLTVTVSGSVDGVNFATIQSFAAVTGTQAAPVRLAIVNVIEPYLQVSWAVSGAGATFNGVSCDLLMTSPDA